MLKLILYTSIIFFISQLTNPQAILTIKVELELSGSDSDTHDKMGFDFKKNNSKELLLEICKLFDNEYFNLIKPFSEAITAGASEEERRMLFTGDFPKNLTYLHFLLDKITEIKKNCEIPDAEKVGYNCELNSRKAILEKFMGTLEDYQVTTISYEVTEFTERLNSTLNELVPTNNGLDNLLNFFLSIFS